MWVRLPPARFMILLAIQTTVWYNKIMPFSEKYPIPSCYNRLIRIHPRRKRGYVRFYDPEHPLCDCCGIVYFHRHVASVQLGRWVESGEAIHHIDGNKENNVADNLMVLSPGEHTILHNEILGHDCVKDRVCAVCGVVFLGFQDRKYCSQVCTKIGRRKFSVIDCDTLIALVWSKPTRVIAAEYGVSDTAVAKRCKALGISKPPRGYWAKVYSERGVAQK